MIIGIDEAGRGAWAGPLIVGAVGLGAATIAGLRDSKLLSRTRRERLNYHINLEAAYVGIGAASPREIDRLGLTRATRLAIKRSLAKADKYSKIIIDGKFNFLKDNARVDTLVRADTLIAEVMAASIIAKVYRDNYMITQSDEFPGYSFASNVGYGTAAHRLAIARNGLNKLHRRTYKPLRPYA